MDSLRIACVKTKHPQNILFILSCYVSTAVVWGYKLHKFVWKLTRSGADPENIHGRWLTGWLPIVKHTGAKGVAG